MNTTIQELLSHSYVRIALAVVGVILVGSVGYYVVASSPPALAYVPATRGAINEDVIANGSVSPAENPDLAFTSGGRVTDISVKVGDTVHAGTLLASLDVGVQSANLAAAQANYSLLAAGPRSVDLAGKQTAVAQANAAVNNSYASLSSVIAGDLASSEDAVHATDFLFGNFNVVDYPRINFRSGDSEAADQAGQERGALQKNFDIWNNATESLTASTSPTDLDAALENTVNKLIQMRQFFDDLAAAANDADPALSSSEVQTITTGRATVNGLILALQQEQQTITNQKLAAQSAQDALNLTQAGATPQAIAAAAAQVNAAQATLAQGEIIAPFDGTIAAVQVKEGDVVQPNHAAVSIVPNGKFEVDVFLSEIDVAKVITGDTADVTLDAYGTGTPFAATVGTVDKAPTIVNGVPSYKVTLIFATDDARIAAGMHASATIHAGAKADALIVPKGAVITENDQTYVLVEKGGKSVKTPVTVGLIGATSTEIISGISEGDSVAAVAGNY